jgi:hypothetical protein
VEDYCAAAHEWCGVFGGDGGWDFEYVGRFPDPVCGEGSLVKVCTAVGLVVGTEVLFAC